MSIHKATIGVSWDGYNQEVIGIHVCGYTLIPLSATRCDVYERFNNTPIRTNVCLASAMIDAIMGNDDKGNPID
jgi:hypothetical protein